MNKFWDVIKESISKFVGQTTLNTILVSVGIALCVISCISKSVVPFYFGFTFLVIWICNLLRIYVPKYYEHHLGQKAQKYYSDENNQKKILDELSSEEMEIVQNLYEIHPQGYE